MKRTDAQRAFFQGLLVRWRSNHEFGVPWERLSPDGICRTFHGSAVSSPRVFHIDNIYDGNWEIDVGEGYREIDAGSEKFQEGDELWNSAWREWIKATPTMFCQSGFFRRKVETASREEDEDNLTKMQKEYEDKLTKMQKEINRLREELRCALRERWVSPLDSGLSFK